MQTDTAGHDKHSASASENSTYSSCVEGDESSAKFRGSTQIKARDLNQWMSDMAKIKGAICKIFSLIPGS